VNPQPHATTSSSASPPQRGSPVTNPLLGVPVAFKDVRRERVHPLREAHRRPRQRCTCGSPPSLVKRAPQRTRTTWVEITHRFVAVNDRGFDAEELSIKSDGTPDGCIHPGVLYRSERCRDPSSVIAGPRMPNPLRNARLIPGRQPLVSARSLGHSRSDCAAQILASRRCRASSAVLRRCEHV